MKCCKLCGGDLVSCTGEEMRRKLSPHIEMRFITDEYRCEECSEEYGVNEAFIRKIKAKAMGQLTVSIKETLKAHPGQEVPIRINSNCDCLDWVYVTWKP